MCRNSTKERHLQCAVLRRSEREVVREGNRSWACCAMYVRPSIVQRNDIKPLPMEVKNADIKPGNTTEEVALTLGGILC